MNQANACYAKLPIVSSLHVFSMKMTLCCLSPSSAIWQTLRAIRAVATV